MKMIRCVYLNDAMNYSTESDMHDRKLNVVQKPDTQEKDANNGSNTGKVLELTSIISHSQPQDVATEVKLKMMMIVKKAI